VIECGVVVVLNTGLVPDAKVRPPDVVMVAHDAPPVPSSYSKYKFTEFAQPPLPAPRTLAVIVKVSLTAILTVEVGAVIATPFGFHAAEATLTIPRRNRIVKAICLIIFSFIRISRMRRFFFELI
jgi:ABC-type phosphate/phosphonate transport system permease subunit